MNVTATLFGQMITFAVLVWFIHRFLWGPLTGLLAERNRRIADGLAAAERGKQDLERAAERTEEILGAARQKAQETLAHADKRAAEIVEEAKAAAQAQGEQLVAGAKAEINQEVFRAKEALRTQVAALAVAGAEKILRREVDAKTHADLLRAVEAEL